MRARRRCRRDPERLAEYFTFTDFGHFIEVYLSVVDLIRDAQDVHTLTYEVARGLAGQNVRYAELTVTPFTSVRAGVPAEEFCAAIEDARLQAERDFGIALRWCFDIPGEAGIEAADATVDIALTQQPAGLISFGLGGPEVGVPRPQFARHFAAARAAGLHSAPHAGESTGPQTIWDAIETLGAERIGHGITAAQDPRLMAYLAEHRIALEVCPTSNVCTRSVPSLAEHPLAAFGGRRGAGHHQFGRSADVLHHAEPGIRRRRRASRTGPPWDRRPGRRRDRAFVRLIGGQGSADRGDRRLREVRRMSRKAVRERLSAGPSLIV